MRPVSHAEFEAAHSGGMARSEHVVPGIRTIPVPMPGGSPLRYTLAVLAEAPATRPRPSFVPNPEPSPVPNPDDAQAFSDPGGITLLDPGWGTDAGFDALCTGLRDAGYDLTDVRRILVTHAHPDHLGSVDRLRDTTGAPLLISRREQDSLTAFDRQRWVGTEAKCAEWGVPTHVFAHLQPRLRDQMDIPNVRPADMLLDDGAVLDVAGGQWRALVTPGHTPGHLCFVDNTRRLLFSGDHVLPTVHPGLGLGADPPTTTDNPIAAYLAALERLAPYDDYQVIPGHGYRFYGLAARRMATTRHVLRRAREVRDVVREHPTWTTWAVASRLTWTGGWARLTTSPSSSPPSPKPTCTAISPPTTPSPPHNPASAPPQCRHSGPAASL